MPRNKLKLITLDLEDTLWPNTKVVIAAENAMWKFVISKFPDLQDSFTDNLISDVRTSLVKKDESLKYDLTRFRKEIIKELLLGHGADESSATYYSNEGLMSFLKQEIKFSFIRMLKLF